MKVLVIPDVHLKPWMFARASAIIEEGMADRAVCLMDIPDDFKKQFQLELYVQTYDAAISFATEYPQTLWCYGNHDLCYVWNRRETGYSVIAPRTVCKKLEALKKVLPDEKQLAYIHRIGNVLFSHGGLATSFARQYIPEDEYGDVDAVIETINGFGCEKMWQDHSPIWYRPQYYGGKLYREDTFLQVVGHTPVSEITRDKNLISCDVFSLNRMLRPIGTQEFPVIDTDTWECHGVR